MKKIEILVSVNMSLDHVLGRHTRIGHQSSLRVIKDSPPRISNRVRRGAGGPSYKLGQGPLEELLTPEHQTHASVALGVLLPHPSARISAAKDFSVAFVVRRVNRQAQDL